MTSISHLKFPRNKTLWPCVLQLKARVTTTRNDFYKSHVLIRKLNKFKWKYLEGIKPYTYSKKILLCQKILSLSWVVFTSLVDIGTNHILELDQRNHADVLDVEEIMCQIRLHVIKFDRLGGLIQNSQITLTSMHKERNKKK